MKKDVPEHIKEKAREMAQQELARKLEELDMSLGEAKEYSALLNEVQSHIAQLHDLLESACHCPIEGYYQRADAECSFWGRHLTAS